MEVLFIVLMSIVVIYFVAKLAVSLYFHSSSGIFYKAFVIDIMQYISVLMYIVMAIMLAVCLELMQVYGEMEVKLAALSLSIVGVLYFIDRAVKIGKSRHLVSLYSRKINLKTLAKSDKFMHIMSMSASGVTIKDSNLLEFEALLAENGYEGYKLSVNKAFISKMIGLAMPILLSAIILAAGIVLNT